MSVASSLDGGSGRSSRASTPDELTPSLPVRTATRQELCVSCIAAAAAAAALHNQQQDLPNLPHLPPPKSLQDSQELKDPPVQQVLQPPVTPSDDVDSRS